jgi:YcxB-like protein
MASRDMIDYIHVQNDRLVELSGTFAFRDLLNYQYSHCYRRTWWIVLLMTLVSLGGVLLAVLVALLTPDLRLAVHNGTPFLLLLAFWLCIVAAPYWAAKRLLKTSNQLSAPITHTFSTQAMHSTGIHSSSDISYDALWDVRETKSLYLLYLNASAAIVLPKRFFRDATQEKDWRLLIEERISPKSITKSGFLGRWL